MNIHAYWHPPPHKSYSHDIDVVCAMQLPQRWHLGNGTLWHCYLTMLVAVLLRCYLGVAILGHCYVIVLLKSCKFGDVTLGPSSWPSMIAKIWVQRHAIARGQKHVFVKHPFEAKALAEAKALSWWLGVTRSPTPNSQSICRNHRATIRILGLCVEASCNCWNMMNNKQIESINRSCQLHWTWSIALR